MPVSNVKTVRKFDFVCPVVALAVLCAVSLSHWAVESPWLSGVFPDSSGIPTLGIVALSLIGLALLASCRTVRGWHRIPASAGGLIGIFALVDTVLTALPDLARGDTWMSAGTAACLVLLGAGAVFLLGTPRGSGLHVAAILGSGALGLALASFIGHLSSVPEAYGWGGAGGMGIPAALAAALLAMALLARAWRRQRRHQEAPPRWGSLPAGVVILTITIVFWHAFEMQRARGGTDAVLPPLLLFLGLLLASFFGIAVHFAQSAGRRAQQLERLARIDPLTELPNRNLFEERLLEALARRDRINVPIALLWLDLDDFKTINDSLGHPAGDEVLKVVAGRLRSVVRRSDTLARLGGDEFAILQNDVNDSLAATQLARAVLECVEQEFEVEERRIHTSVSIGIAISRPQTSADELLKQADIALYEAKRDGRRTFRFHSAEMDADVQEYMATIEQLHEAAARGDFMLRYQPQFDLSSGDLVGAEALLRWKHPTRGPLGPHEFLRAAENSGLITPIGLWAVREACQQRKTWDAEGHDRVPITLNLSAAQLNHTNFTESLLETLNATRLPPDVLEVELSEADYVHRVGKVADAIESMRRFGVRISIDDFGSGAVRLVDLVDLPVHRIKIAMALVHGAAKDDRKRAVLASIIDLAHRLDIQTVAVGVENEEQLVVLQECGCDQAQGFFLGRPVAPEDLEIYLRPRSAAL